MFTHSGVFSHGWIWFFLPVPAGNVTHDLARSWKRNGIMTRCKK